MTNQDVINFLQHKIQRDPYSAEEYHRAIEALDKTVAEKPTYMDGCGFPHCPNCNADLDIRCDKCHDSAISYGNYYEYCHECGQRLGWEGGAK